MPGQHRPQPDERHELAARHHATGRLVLDPVEHPGQRLIDRRLMPAHVE
jgi:hypothetical protein